MSRAFKIGIIAAFASFTLIPAAAAQAGIEEVSVRVPYGDLDMSKSAGGVVLLKRIESAARNVCYQAVPRTVLKLRSYGKCRRQTIADTVSKLNISTLTMAWNKTQSPAVQLSAR